MKEFRYVINGITINEDMANEIAEKYEHFCNVRDISDILEIDMDLAEKIAEHYEEVDWKYEVNVYLAIERYTNRFKSSDADMLLEAYKNGFDMG